MTYSRLLKYQSLLLERPVTKLKVCGNLNPATILPEKENETPDHDCSQFLTLNYAAWEDLKDTPLDNLDMGHSWDAEDLTLLPCPWKIRYYYLGVFFIN